MSNFGWNTCSVIRHISCCTLNLVFLHSQYFMAKAQLYYIPQKPAAVQPLIRSA